MPVTAFRCVKRLKNPRPQLERHPNATVSHLKDRKARLIVTLDRNSVAALFYEINAALYDRQFSGSNGAAPMVMGKVAGIGGIPVTLANLADIVEEGLAAVKLGKIEKDIEWIALKGITFDPTREVIAE